LKTCFAHRLTADLEFVFAANPAAKNKKAPHMRAVLVRFSPVLYRQVRQSDLKVLRRRLRNNSGRSRLC
jgi:hypothetical protein